MIFGDKAYKKKVKRMCDKRGIIGPLWNYFMVLSKSNSSKIFEGRKKAIAEFCSGERFDRAIKCLEGIMR